MFSANTVMRPSAPPVNMSNMPRNAAAVLGQELTHDGCIDAGDGDVGADTVDDQRTQGEPDALFEFRGLGESAEA